MTEPQNCPWWLRWLHRRQRRMDREVLWIPLIAGALNDIDEGYIPSTKQALKRAWQDHVRARGQEHWRCPCGTSERLAFEAEHGL